MRAFEEYKQQQGVLLGLWAIMYRQDPRTSPTLTCRWRCFPRGRTFHTKASLSVHFFKTHRRRAGFRSCVVGSCCKACGREFWTVNKLAVHLRDHPLCVAKLQAHGLVSETPTAGVGSRVWRQREVEQYTPACRTEQRIAEPGATGWPQEQKDAHRALCDVILNPAERREQIRQGAFLTQILGKFPLYQSEMHAM